MKAVVTTLLDALGLLLVSAGAVAGAALVIGVGPALAVGGLVILAGSWLADRNPRGSAGGEG
ncbi:MAG: hypothetical protein ACRDRN_16850 [Sciscionella sp.]